MKNRFIFDLDDTLIVTGEIYARAEQNLVKLIQNRLYPNAPTDEHILKISRQIDTTSIKKQGLSKERFPSSFREAYTLILIENEVAPEKVKEESYQAYEVGMQVFDPKNWVKKMMPGARETLEYLIGQKDELHLITAGDLEVQNSKIEFYNLRPFFEDRIQVTPFDKRGAIRNVTKGYSKENIWFVGDSPRSDIVPALECGIGAIHIPPKSMWSHNNHPLENEKHPKKIILPRINDIVALYPSHFAN
jgi:putative hydrolase of the HAD superfamily